VKVEIRVFSAMGLFLAPVTVVYGVVTNWKEWVGVVALALSVGLCAMITAYLWVTSRRIDARPEDNPRAEVADGAGELGHFAPYSWWPFWGGLAAAGAFAGLAVGGWWLLLISFGLAGVAVVGWVFEFYRGEHAH
jgi:hypothetical protein